MTDFQIEEIYRSNLGDSNISALRGVWLAGYLEGKGTVPTASAIDTSKSIAKPTLVPTVKR